MELSLETLIATLTSASDTERNASQQMAEDQLSRWESASGFYALLQQAYLHQELLLQVRWLAIICFKNGIDKYWRASRQHAIAKPEKERIRAHCFDLLNEKNNALAVQNAHSVAKIARYDFPSEWPTLFDDCAKSLTDFAIKNDDLISTNNLLVILGRIIKSIAAVRIGRSRHALQSKAPVIMDPLINIYVALFRRWTSSAELDSMQVCYNCLKTLRRIIPQGFESPHKNQDVAEFIALSIDHLQLLVTEHEKFSLDLLEKFIKCYTKLYLELINANPTAFVLLPCSLKVLNTFLALLDQKALTIYLASDENSFWQVLALRGFLIFKRILAYVYKKGAVTLTPHDDKQQVHACINRLQQEYFTPHVVQHLCDLLIEWYLRLTPSDMESWLVEPEEWANEQMAASWEYQVRPCAENFFRDLIKCCGEPVRGHLLTKIENALTSASTDTLAKDSILCAVQLLASQIADHVNFDMLLADVLVPILTSPDLPELKVLRRRVCCVIDEWVGVLCSRESRIHIYKYLSDLLSRECSSNDTVVRIAAAKTLKTVVDDWDFQKQDFIPHMGHFVRLLLLLLNDLSLTETKLFVLDTLAVLIERLNPLVDQQTLLDILAVVPQYWEQSVARGESILHNLLLRVLKSLAVLLNENSPETYQIAIPLVLCCCAEGSQFHSLLAEDGYDLWLVLLQFCPNTHTNTPELLQLFSMVPYGLENATEILPTLLSIARSYALFPSALFPSDISLEILRVLAHYIKTMRDDAYAIFISLMDILVLRLSSNESFVQQLVASGLFKTMTEIAIDPETNPVIANKQFLILSRLATASAPLFLQMLAHMNVRYEMLFEAWLRCFPNNGSVRNKKASILGMMALVFYGVREDVVGWAAIFPRTVREAFIFSEEVNENSDGNCDVYSKDMLYDDIDDYRYLDANIRENGEKIRYVELVRKQDPVINMNCREFLTQNLIQLRSCLPSQQFTALLGMCDQYLIEHIENCC